MRPQTSPTWLNGFSPNPNYPTEAHEEQERLRSEWAEKLAPENIANFSRQELTAVASHGNVEQSDVCVPESQRCNAVD